MALEDIIESCIICSTIWKKEGDDSAQPQLVTSANQELKKEEGKRETHKQMASCFPSVAYQKRVQYYYLI